MPRAAASWSLRRRIAWVSLACMVAALTFGGVAMYWSASIEEAQLLDSQLELLGSTLAALVEDQLDAKDGSERSEIARIKIRPLTLRLYRYQVWSREGSLMLRSHAAPSKEPLASLQVQGFDSVRVAGRDYRVYSQATKDGRFVVQVAQSVEERAARIGMIVGYYVSFLLLPIGVVSGAAWWLLRRSFSAIHGLADDLGRRNPLDLDTPDIKNPPLEMLPILASLEALFGRIARAISVERSFTAAAAHEMRTPLAGVRAYAQLAQRAETPAALHASLAELVQSVDRSTRALDQLLDLARIERLSGVGESTLEWVDVPNTYQIIMSDLGPTALRKGLMLRAEFPADRLQASSVGLHLLMRNLLANAFLYTPAGGAVAISTRRAEGVVRLTVDDSGPGIAPQNRERAFERFNRLGQTGGDGSGLGLSIVLQVVNLYRASIRLLDSPSGGLRVEVDFPLAEASTREAAAAETAWARTAG